MSAKTKSLDVLSVNQFPPVRARDQLSIVIWIRPGTIAAQPQQAPQHKLDTLKHTHKPQDRWRYIMDVPEGRSFFCKACKANCTSQMRNRSFAATAVHAFPFQWCQCPVPLGTTKPPRTLIALQLATSSIISCRYVAPLSFWWGQVRSRWFSANG